MKTSTTTVISQENPLYTCPEDTIAGRNGNPKRSYGISAYREVNNDDINLGISGSQNLALELSRKSNAISSASETILLSENFHKNNRMGFHWGSINAGTHYNISLNNDSCSPLPHAQKFNYLFVDGHAQILSYYSTLLGQSPSTDDARNTMWDAGR